MKSNAKAGFLYTVEVIAPDGSISQREERLNLIPTEGLNHLIGVEFASVPQVTAWFIGLFSNNYTPTPSAVAATIAAVSGETGAYSSSAARVPFTPGAVSAGSVDNTASPGLFTFAAATTVYGGFIVSSPVIGGVTGVLGSLVRFATPKQLDVNSVLRVIAGNSLISN
jgi:hypothetical protein